MDQRNKNRTLDHLRVEKEKRTTYKIKTTNYLKNSELPQFLTERRLSNSEPILKHSIMVFFSF